MDKLQGCDARFSNCCLESASLCEPMSLPLGTLKGACSISSPVIAFGDGFSLHSILTGSAVISCALELLGSMLRIVVVERLEALKYSFSK